MTNIETKFEIGALVILIAGLAGATGCAWMSSHQAALTADAEREAACILAHSGEPVTAIAVECGGIEIKIVEDLLSAQRAAARASAPCGSGASK